MRKVLVRGQGKDGVGHGKLENRNHLQRDMLDKACCQGGKQKDFGIKE